MEHVDFWFRLPLRTRLGIIGFGIVTGAILLLFLAWNAGAFFFGLYHLGGILLFGVILILFWCAWNDLKNIPWWHWFIMIVLLLICAVKPAFWLIGVPVIGYILFQGRKKKS